MNASKHAIKNVSHKYS